MSKFINLIPTDNEVVLVNQDRGIIVADQDAFTQIEVTQPITSVVQILTGPAGPRGPAGPQASFPYTGSADITGSFSLVGPASITGSLFLINGSFSGSGANLFDIPASAIVGLNLSRITTGSVTASVGLDSSTFTVQSASIDMIKVQSDKVLVLASSSITPSVIAGGIFFSASGDFFFGS